MPGESLNILMHDIAMYTHANVEKTANSQVHLDARSDYNLLKMLSSKGGLYFLFFLWDVVICLSKVSNILEPHRIW